MHRSAAVLALLLAVACAPSRSLPSVDPQARSAPLTVCVANRTLDVLTIRLGSRSGVRLASVQPGQVQRVTLPRGVEVGKVVAVPVGGGPLLESPPITRSHASAWRWSLGISATTAIDLQPYRGGCEGRAAFALVRHGFTVWLDGEPSATGWVSASLILNDPQEAAAVAMHEAAHERRALELGRGPWLAKLRDVRAWAGEEAFAFCVQSHYAISVQRRFPTVEVAAWHYAEWLANGYPFGLTREQAAVAIVGACPAGA